MKAFYDSLNEKDRRRYAAIEAIKLGHGGQIYISSVLGCHFQTVMAGINEITNGTETPEDRIRKPGGGKKKIIDTVENIDEIFFDILKNHTAGSPMDEELKWTNLNLKEISKVFKSKGMNITPYVVKQLLKKHGFVKRKMQKAVTMKDSKDRNEQFERIHELKEEYSKSANPIISIDVKKEVIGNFYRDGKVYCTHTVKVYDHDFNTFSDGVVIPHGIYDLKSNEGYITLGTSKDTSEFCCDCIKDWWEKYGKNKYPKANSILTLADGGGSNSSRHYIFKEDMQKMVNEIGIEIRMAHYPPYTSKYNPIEHRLFCHVTNACKGTVFSNIEMVKSLVEKTYTSTGLKVFSTIKDKVYATGKK
ncbi:MAG: ISAzo13 family transposase [Methanosarcina barkeri]|nr:ISAzo13 family transposase [Methanosarcina sp. ERenArc_MAG2]